MAVVAGLKDSLVGLDTYLEAVEGLLLQRRPSWRLRMAAPDVGSAVPVP